MPSQEPWSDDVLAETARHPCHGGGLKVKSLSCLDRKLGATAVAQGQTMGALETETG